MATSSVKKMQLEDAPMFTSHLRGGKDKSYISYEWIINDFSQLKKNVVYRDGMPEYGNGYTVVKTKRTLLLTLYTNLYNLKTKCYVCYQPDHHYRECPPVNEYERGAYACQIPLEYLFVPENISWRSDSVHIQIRLDICRQRNLTVRPFIGEIKNTCVQRLSRDLSHGAQHLEDFEMTRRDRIFPVHKAILAARSRIFRDYFAGKIDNYKEKFITPDTAVESALFFMLTGTFTVTEDVTCMMELLYESVNLQIPSLQSLCTAALKDEIKTYNFYDIWNIGKKTGIQVLVEAVDKFLADRGLPNVPDDEE